MNRIEDIVTAIQKRDEERHKNTVLWVLAIIGAVTAIAGIAYAVYRYLTPDYLEKYDDDFEDDLEDYFEDDLEETPDAGKEKEEAADEDDEEEIFVDESKEEPAKEE